ncbi:unnamed protein product [Protopolystoma xenopodis]|uniref:Uncharacterized protein n=1 Tax=Protopolystoma xenopodis TaxID=117903 RepID=A0A3S5B4I5_9PLAT|nr:unnamed protein product [Protopolystoma xenopodis]
MALGRHRSYSSHTSSAGVTGSGSLEGSVSNLQSGFSGILATSASLAAGLLVSGQTSGLLGSTGTAIVSGAGGTVAEGSLVSAATSASMCSQAGSLSSIGSGCFSTASMGLTGVRQSAGLFSRTILSRTGTSSLHITREEAEASDDVTRAAGKDSLLGLQASVKEVEMEEEEEEEEQKEEEEEQEEEQEREQEEIEETEARGRWRQEKMGTKLVKAVQGGGGDDERSHVGESSLPRTETIFKNEGRQHKLSKQNGTGMQSDLGLYLQQSRVTVTYGRSHGMVEKISSVSKRENEMARLNDQSPVGYKEVTCLEI